MNKQLNKQTTEKQTNQPNEKQQTNKQTNRETKETNKNQTNQKKHMPKNLVCKQISCSSRAQSSGLLPNCCCQSAAAKLLVPVCWCQREGKAGRSQSPVFAIFTTTICIEYMIIASSINQVTTNPPNGDSGVY